MLIVLKKLRVYILEIIQIIRIINTIEITIYQYKYAIINITTWVTLE